MRGFRENDTENSEMLFNEETKNIHITMVNAANEIRMSRRNG